jgi:hypothetical protein
VELSWFNPFGTLYAELASTAATLNTVQSTLLTILANQEKILAAIDANIMTDAAITLVTARVLDSVGKLQRMSTFDK